jgi:hypothetical protein
MLTTAIVLLGVPGWLALPGLTASATRVVLVARALPALYRLSP